MDLLDNMYCADNGRWYETPISWYGLARLFGQSAWHQSALYFKRNVIANCFRPHKLLSRQTVMGLALDYATFGNGYLELRDNRLREPLHLRYTPAKYTRRGSDLDTYWLIQNGEDEYEFPRKKVCHIINPDINQEIYGMPEYLGALLSASLSHSADKFRTMFYDNGSHAGCIVYVNSATADKKSIANLKDVLNGTRQGNAFKNVLIHSTGGKDGDVKILPFSQISAKDEFLSIKSATRDDILAAHRVPPQLMGAMPQGGGSLGDIEKAARVFAINELTPMMSALQQVNEWLGEEVVTFNPYELLQKNAADDPRLTTP
jgi:PBSX family phage portal protein